MKDLAPTIYRQRMIIEGKTPDIISEQQIKDYLEKISDVLGMHRLTDGITHRSDKFGWAGWIHWETSGAHFYAWEEPFSFFSVDIYTCKKFNETDALNFTKKYFKTTEIEYKSIMQ